MRKKERILLFLFTLAFIGLYFSKTVLSFFPYVLILYGLYQKNGYDRLKSIYKNKAITSIIAVFFIYILSGINSQNISMWFGRLNTNLIYIAIPLGVYLSGPYKKDFINKLLIIFLVLNILIDIYLLIDYSIHFDQINDSYLRGKSLRTPIPHIIYSFFVVISIMISTYFSFVNKSFKNRYLFIIATVFLIIFVFILAVRTGILALFITSIVLLIYYGIKTRSFKLSLLVVSLFIILGYLSYLFFPSFKNKIKYSYYDIKSTLTDSAKYHTSDRVRIVSIKAGLSILKEHPLFGSGIGDIEDELDKIYNKIYPDLPKHLRTQPGSQYIFTLASMGIIGFLLLYGLLLVPVFVRKKKHILLIPFYILTFTSCIGETTIEFMVGKTAFLIFTTLFICYKKEETAQIEAF